MAHKESLTLDTLPPEIRDAVTNKRISGRKKLGRWLVFLKTLSEFDEQVDAQYNKVKKRSVGFGVLTFVCLFASIFALAFSEGNLVVLASCGSVVFLLFVFFMVNWLNARALKKINLENSFRETVLPFLAILSEEISPKDKITLDLNLGDPTAKQYKVSEQKLPPGRNRKLIERTYCFPACHAKIPLENGTLLLLDLVKNPVSYDRYYRSSSGKSKHKKKWKLIIDVTAGLVPVSEEFQVSEAEVERMTASAKVKLKEKKGGQLCCLREKLKFKSAKGVPDENVSPEALVEMFMKLCTMLNPAA
ncbi:MAG: hypothetical protein KKD44_17500 [Proteobacteria bacterium]|nr:hypothetical protein [Pseudomonadota bacterium]